MGEGGGGVSWVLWGRGSPGHLGSLGAGVSQAPGFFGGGGSQVLCGWGFPGHPGSVGRGVPHAVAGGCFLDICVLQVGGGPPGFSGWGLGVSQMLGSPDHTPHPPRSQMTQPWAPRSRRRWRRSCS